MMKELPQADTPRQGETLCQGGCVPKGRVVRAARPFCRAGNVAGQAVCEIWKRNM